MTKGKEPTIEKFRGGTQPFVTGSVLRGMIVQAGFTSAIRLATEDADSATASKGRFVRSASWSKFVQSFQSSPI